MAAKTISTDEIKRHLRRCGYQDDCLQEGYVYFLGSKKHVIDLVGFARKTFNSENACIGLTSVHNLSETQIEEHVISYRELGAPAVLVSQENELQFWSYRQNNAVLNEKVKHTDISTFFKRYQKEFTPDRILQAKTFGRSNRKYQLTFADVGLMPLIEEKEGKYLFKLINRIIEGLECYGHIQQSDDGARWLTQAAFWLVGAKILKDKEVPGFRNLDLANVDSLICKIKRHYNAETTLDISDSAKREALERVADKVVNPISSLSHITINSLAYIYENALVTPATRKALGTHATPSWLVNYIVWQMSDWIEDIPEKKRLILEPACGHAPFLTITAKLLGLLYSGPENKRHDYLKNHLIGMDADSFALEIARLSLTLADIPNQNGWQMVRKDIYRGGALVDAAKNATILFCNPPFQDFTPEETKQYEHLETGNKAAEILARTLPYMPEGSVFGVVLPQGFLHKKNLTDLRKYILYHCELRQICNLPDNTFEHARHVSTVLLGRKVKNSEKLSYLRVSNQNLEHFKETFEAPEEKISQSAFLKTKDYSFRAPELQEIWEYCKTFSVLSNTSVVGQGLVYKGRELPKGAITFRNKPFKGGIEGFASYDKNILINELPPAAYLNLSREVIRRPQWGTDIGKPQVLLNYARVSADYWRLKAWIDNYGHPVNSNFLVVRPKNLNEWSLECIWALLNSPFANAFVYCHSMERHNTAGTIRTIPVPEINHFSKIIINELVSEYFSICKSLKEYSDSTLKNKAKETLLFIDAEILRLYDLPHRMEKKLLDFFAGVERKGVPFKFDRYYPEGYESFIPLHVFVSEDFQNSKLENVKKWVEKYRTPEIQKAFKHAVEAFEECK